MNRLRLLLVACLAVMMVACKGEKKIATYETLYKEQPVTVLIAPVNDNAKRDVVKTTQDQVFSDELSKAACFLRQSCIDPLVAMGYFPMPMLASDEILKKFGKNYRQLMLDDIKALNAEYGIDAVLLIAVHKWAKPETNEIVAYLEYTLRSTKSGLELMHTWVRANKMQPVDDKGEAIPLAADNDFMRMTGLDPLMTNRCRLMAEASSFVLRNMPTSASRWQFKRDKYVPAYPNYYKFTLNPDGSVERSRYNEDAFGNECFTD